MDWHKLTNFQLQHWRPWSTQLKFSNAAYCEILPSIKACQQTSWTKDGSSYGYVNKVFPEIIYVYWQFNCLDGVFLSVSAEKASHMANATLRVPYEGQHQNFMVGLAAHHQLHCIDILRKSFHPERYNNSIYNEDKTINEDQWFHHSESRYLFLKNDSSL